MAQMLLTFKIMPKSLEVNLDALLEEIKTVIEKFGAEFSNASEELVAFGLKALKVIVIVDENISNFDPLEENISRLEGVQSCTIEDMRRMFG